MYFERMALCCCPSYRVSVPCVSTASASTSPSPSSSELPSDSPEGASFRTCAHFFPFPIFCTFLPLHFLFDFLFLSGVWLIQQKLHPWTQGMNALKLCFFCIGEALNLSNNEVAVHLFRGFGIDKAGQNWEFLELLRVTPKAVPPTITAPPPRPP